MTLFHGLDIINHVFDALLEFMYRSVLYTLLVGVLETSSQWTCEKSLAPATNIVLVRM